MADTKKRTRAHVAGMTGETAMRMAEEDMAQRFIQRMNERNYPAGQETLGNSELPPHQNFYEARRRREMEFEASVDDVLDTLRTMLLEKNRAYGRSALEPVRIFSRTGPEEAIRVRIDDKLSRLVQGQGDTEDSELDLLGYLVLLRVARRRGK